MTQSVHPQYDIEVRVLNKAIVTLGDLAFRSTKKAGEPNLGRVVEKLLAEIQHCMDVPGGLEFGEHRGVKIGAQSNTTYFGSECRIEPSELDVFVHRASGAGPLER